MNKKLLILLTCCFYTFFAFQASAMNKQEVEKIIQNYLLQHPEILLKASDVLEKKRETALTAERTKILSSYGSHIYNAGEDLVLGNAHAPHTIVEYFDYNCPYCKESGLALAELVKKHSDLRVIIKDLPILGEESLQAHMIARAFHKLYPKKQEEFWREMMKLPGRADKQSTFAVAAKLGADVKTLEKNLADEKWNTEIQAYLRENIQLALALKINGTPCYIVNNKLYGGVTDLEMLVKEASKSQ